MSDSNLVPLTSAGIQCSNCFKPAFSKFTCKHCQDLHIKSLFCSQQCYLDNYKTHKQLHKTAPVKAYDFPEGTEDAFAGFRYAGPLRAVIPSSREKIVPKREVPSTIDRPDYAGNKKGISMREVMTNSIQRKGKVLNATEIEGMRVVCRLAREVLDIAAAMVAPGVTTLEIDAVVHAECIKRNAYPSPLNYGRFPRSVCTSINETICHGIPDHRPLEDGDIINLDVTLYYGGFHGDVNGTYPVGKVSARNLELIATTRKCLDAAIRICKPGLQINEIGNTIEPIAKEKGFSVVRSFVGHGINQLFHCAPDVSHYASNRDYGTLKAGMCFTIEPMINIGVEKAHESWPDRWTVTTKDGKNSAQFEETLLITETGVEVLTAGKDWVA